MGSVRCLAGYPAGLGGQSGWAPALPSQTRGCMIWTQKVGDSRG
jgi:hypothetical protein